MEFTVAMRGWPIYASNFFMACALGVVFVFLEDVQIANGLADWHVGAIAGSGFAAALVAQLVLSPLADRGRVAPLAIGAVGASAVGTIGFAYGGNVTELAISRGVAGVGFGVFGLIAKKALIGIDASGGGAKLGLLLSTAVAGFILGPVIGAALEPIGFEAPFVFVAIAVAVVGIPATIAILRAEIATSETVDYRDLAELLRRPRVQAAMLVTVIVLGSNAVFTSTVDRFLTDLDASTTTVAIVILFIGAPLLVLPRFSGGLAERRGGSAVMLPALFLFVPVMFGYGLAGSVLAVIVFGVIHGSGESIGSIAAQVLVLEVTGPRRAAVGSALLEVSGLLAATVAATIAPSMYGDYGQSVYLGTGVVGIVLGAWAFQRVRNATD